MRRVSRVWVKRGAIALVAVLAALWVGYIVVLPWLAGRALRAKLADVGIGTPDFRLGGVTFHGIEIIGLRLGGLSVGHLGVTYHPLALLRGRLDAIEISGARVQLDYVNGKLQVGGLDPFAAPADGAARPLPVTRHVKAGGPQPIERLALTASELVLNIEGRELHLPFSGTLGPNPDGPGSSLDLKIWVLDTPLAVTGTADIPAGRAALRADVNGLTINTLLAFAPASWGLRGGGTIAMHSDYQLTPTGQTFSAAVSRSDAWLTAKLGPHYLTLDGVIVRFDGWTQSAGAKLRLAGNASAQLRLDSTTTASMTVQGNGTDSGPLSFGINLHSPEWQARLTDAQVQGLATGKITATSGLTIEGQLPPVVRTAILESGIDTTELGKASLSGNLTGKFAPHPTPATSTSAPVAGAAWSADFSGGHLRLDRGTLSVPKVGVALRGFLLDANLTAAADPSGGSVVIKQWANVAAGVIEHPRTGRIRAENTAADLVDLTLTETDAKLTFARGSGWAASVPGLRMRLAPTNVELSADGDGPRGLAGVMNLDGTSTASGVTLAFRPDSWIGVEKSRLRAGSDPVDLASFGLLVGPVDTKTPAGIRISNKGAEASLALYSKADAPVGVTIGQNALTLSDLRVASTMSAGGGHPMSLKTNVSFDRSSVRLGAAGITLADFKADVPFVQNAGEVPAGSFAFGGVQAGADKWPGITGSLKITNGHLDFATKWPIVKQGTIEGTAAVDLFSPDGAKADVHAWLTKTSITDAATLRSLMSSAQGMTLTGDFAADARLKYERGRLTPLVTVGIEHASFSSEQWAAAIQDLSTSLTFDSLSPLTTPGNQKLTVRHGNVGKLLVENGTVALRVEGARSILIEETTWGWSGGRLYSNAFRFDPSKPNVNMTVYGDTLAVADLLKLFGGPDAGGSGTLYGRLPVTVQWPSLAFGDGFLYATPGPGSFQLGQKASAGFGTLLSQDPHFAPGSSPDSNLVKSRIVDALRNFHYDLLKVDFKNRQQDLLASVKLDGYGEIKGDKQELHLGFNAAGFDQLLHDFLVIKKALGN